MKITERNNLVEANMRLVYYTYAKLYKNSFVVNNKDGPHIRGLFRTYQSGKLI